MNFWQKAVWRIILIVFQTTTLIRIRTTLAKSYEPKRIKRNNMNDAIGGGAINEKLRTSMNQDTDETKSQAAAANQEGFQPQIHKAHLWHALEGFDRYPNYFQRWNNIHWTDADDSIDESEKDDLLSLEQALRETADAVHRERERIARQRKTWHDKIPQFLQQYPQFRKFWNETPYGEDWKSWCDNILHPTIQKLLFTTTTNNSTTSSSNCHLKACPHATVTQVLSGAVPVAWNVSLLTELLDEECLDVFSMPILSHAFCQELIQLIRALQQFLAQDSSIEQPRFFSLSELGITWLDNFLFRVLIQPISLHLFENTRLDWYHSFVAGYASQPSRVTPRQFLVPHTDDSEVTLNLCLGDENFQGGLLEFGPMRGHPTTTRRKPQTETVEPRIGYGLLHVGRLLHQVTPITSGDRFAYIVWTRSWKDTRAKQCPCCWLNHRTDACVCGPQWN